MAQASRKRKATRTESGSDFLLIPLSSSGGRGTATSLYHGRRNSEATVNVQNAGGDVAAQKKQISYFIEQKMDVIVVVAADTSALSDVVAQAKERGIRVVAYDRMLENANVDLYLSFDSEKVGEIYGDAITGNLQKAHRYWKSLVRRKITM